MKNKKLLQTLTHDVSLTPWINETPSQEVIAELQYRLTSFSYGYEYTLMSLDGLSEDHPELSAIEAQLDELKEGYWTTREILKSLDAASLDKVERQLRSEKGLVFGKTQYVH